jgi:DNA-binding MarR family transcriptional regulator
MRRAYTPTLPELQAFAQAARTGSATRAAQALGLTQSAVSRSLATLEDRLGVRLFHRLRQRLTLSDAGRALLPDAERMHLLTIVSLIQSFRGTSLTPMATMSANTFLSYRTFKVRRCMNHGYWWMDWFTDIQSLCLITPQRETKAFEG